jgi:Tol biopolymer transport system component
MKRGVTVVLIGAHRTGNARLVAGLVTVVAAVLAASVLALAAARTAEAAFPGGNGKITFQSDRHGPVEIYAMTPGETATRITTSNNSSDPSYSPDGSKIAFIGGSKTNSSFEVWVMNADGSGRRQVTNTTAAEQEPAWSPDGTRLVYASNSELWTINVDGTRRRQLTSTSSSETEPAWSPDGSKIAFKRSQDIWVMNSDGTGEANVTPNSPAPCTSNCYQGGDEDPAWSPDGSRIAYVHGYGPPTNPNAGGGVPNIWTMDPNGGNKVNVSNNPDTSATQPAWSPDETKIAYVGVASGSTDRNIYVMNADGTSQGPIDTSTAHDINPDWQPITLAVNDVRVKEKNTNAVFTVRLSANSEETITVNYATADGSAKTPADYTAQSGTLTFEPGQTAQQIAIPIRSDRRNEANEKFFVNLSSATNATIFDAQGRASIVDND